jgi:hypothetical protein
VKKIYLLVAPFILLLTACEKDITIDLPDTPPKIVVEGHVETGEHPYVILTRSSGYFDPVDSTTIANTIITDAKVIVTDGVTTDTMTVAFDFNMFPPIYYKAPNMIGVTGRTYSLKVIADDQTITATTTLPAPIPPDSVWFQLQPGNDSLGLAYGHLSDPPGRGNAYRWLAKRLHKDNTFLPAFGGSVFDDEFIEGKSLDGAFYRGMKPGSTAPDDNNEEYAYFKKGDTIVVKFCTIDPAAFQYYRTYETELSSNGNPFAAPTTIRTNITGGLGVWCGYGTAYDTIIAP